MHIFIEFTINFKRGKPRVVFLKRFYSIAPFSLSTRHFRPQSVINQTQGSQLKNFIQRT